jgi:hypothetical protein
MFLVFAVGVTFAMVDGALRRNKKVLLRAQRDRFEVEVETRPSTSGFNECFTIPEWRAVAVVG